MEIYIPVEKTAMGCPYNPGGVRCEVPWACEKCGWNPDEQKRRHNYMAKTGQLWRPGK